MDRRSILVGTGLIAFVVLVGGALYVVFFRGRGPVEEAPPVPITGPVTAPPGITPGLPTAPPGALPLVPGAPTVAPSGGVPPSAIATGGITETTALTDAPVAFARLGTDGRPTYYDPATQRFYRIAADGKPVALSDRQFPNVRQVTWAPRAAQAILEFPDGANVLYDFRTDRQVTLPAHWEGFAFSANGDRIAGKSVGLDRENRWLFEANPDGNDLRILEPLGANARAVDVAWAPHGQVVAFARTGSDLGDGRQQVLAVGRNGENLPALVVEGQDFRPQWSPSGARLLYSVVGAANDLKPELWVVDGAAETIGSDRRRLRVDTWADKCTFADDRTLYCAVPERLERGYGLERRLAATIPDVIERIDLATGMRAVVGKPANLATVRDLALSPDGQTLYLTAEQDGRLYEVKLR